MKYQLLAIDMDGTLLNDSKLIGEKSIAYIKKAVDKGIKFVIASGRVPAGLRYYKYIISRNQPLICCNGAIILDHNKNIILERPLNKDSILKIVDVLREKKDTYYHFYDGDVLCSEQFELAAKRFYKFNRGLERKYRMGIRIVVDTKEYVQRSEHDINKIVVMDKDTEYLKNLRKKIEAIGGIEVTSSNSGNFEINSKGVNKGEALIFLAKYYGIPIEKCIAVGNDENDISMIKNAGLGIAVSNASTRIKGISDYVTIQDNNNDAVVEIINKFIL